MIPTNKTVEIYYLIDEFLKEYDAVIKSHSLEEGAAKKRTANSLCPVAR